MTGDLCITEPLTVWFKKAFNWKSKLATMFILTIAFALLNLHLIVNENKYLKFDIGNRTHFSKMKSTTINNSWIQVRIIVLFFTFLAHSRNWC
jgi:hypothetical protein